MKAVLILLVTALAHKVAECSAANFMADRALEKMSSWIQVEGPGWVTLPGHFEQGIVQGEANDNYTLAMAGPAFSFDGSLSRTSEATLTDGVPDPNYTSSQKLVFTVAIKNITVDYMHVAYNDDNNGFFNITSMATSDGISAVLTVDIKGSGDSCMGFADKVTVSFSGDLYVSTDGVQHAFPQVINAVKVHFKSNVPDSIGLLMEAATFNSLDGYDVCTGVFSPLPEANVMARRIMNAMQDGLNQNIQYWAELPGFWKSDSDLNGTIMDKVVVRVGKFSSIGTLTRIGHASYDNNEEDLNFGNLNMGFEVTNLTAVYGYMEYIDYEIWYAVGETVTARKLTVSLSVTYSRPSLSDRPNCLNATVNATTKYEPSGGPLEYKNLTPNIDDYYVESVNKVLGPGFINSVGGAASNLFNKAAENGDATYSGNGDPKWTYLNMVVDTDTISVMYGNVLYTTNLAQYDLAVRIDAQKLTASISFTFYEGDGSSKPSCLDGSLGASAAYQGGQVTVTSLTPGVPTDVLQKVSDVVTQGFLDNISGGAEDLFISAGKYAQTLGDATYSNNGDSTKTFLNFTIETDKVTGVYGDILYITGGNFQYNLGEQVEAGRIRTSYSVVFTQASGATKPSCIGGAQEVTSQYVTEDEVELTLIGSDVPTYVFRKLCSLVTQGFLDNINGAAEDLFINVGQNALTKVCY